MKSISQVLIHLSGCSYLLPVCHSEFKYSMKYKGRNNPSPYYPLSHVLLEKDTRYIQLLQTSTNWTRPSYSGIFFPFLFLISINIIDREFEIWLEPRTSHKVNELLLFLTGWSGEDRQPCLQSVVHRGDRRALDCHKRARLSPDLYLKPPGQEWLLVRKMLIVFCNFSSLGQA